KAGCPWTKEGNLELLKIPNFLHLTPVAIKKHCEALKGEKGFHTAHSEEQHYILQYLKFCTEWPAALDNDEKCEKHFPVEIETADYVSAGPSVRNPKARVVTLRVKLSSLNLDDHAKKKLIKLVGERYCKTTDVLTIRTDRCPLKRQNYDYAVYLLTVLYHESWKTEEWEKNKTEADMEEYVWENSSSEKNILETLLQIKAAEKNLEVNKEELLGTKEVEDYRKSVVSLKNEGDNESTLSQYKESVKRLLNLT
uniref:Mitochondrial ribosomal protein S35 n=1 Tax=Equus asinus TaxID=9793 RepID=A0A9L0J9G1_EQUAS